MTTTHLLQFEPAATCSSIADGSVDLVVTSPPYPMVAMWDAIFALQDPQVGDFLQHDDGNAAFEAMHCLLDAVWRRCADLVRTGGYLCINVGDATRSIAGEFRLFSNHSRIIAAVEGLGFRSLPLILWRKQTNAPNKFMGSGMLPSGAYVTLEHEYVLIFRKGGKRQFARADSPRRNRSAFFWEERNQWFSDLWDFKGVRQDRNVAPTRLRSAAFPLELAYRLINMYSLQEDCVFDPFLGTGTTMLAAMAAGRSSLGVEIDAAFAAQAEERIRCSAAYFASRQSSRLRDHGEFVAQFGSNKGRLPQHYNQPHAVPVVTKQESQLWIPVAQQVTRDPGAGYTVEYAICPKDPQPVVMRGFEPPSLPDRQLWLPSQDQQ